MTVESYTAYFPDRANRKMEIHFSVSEYHKSGWIAELHWFEQEGYERLLKAPSQEGHSVMQKHTVFGESSGDTYNKTTHWLEETYGRHEIVQTPKM